jgi:hypothetical protein
MRLRSVVACGGLAPLLIAAAQPVRLQPSSPWIVDYGDNSCRLIRRFGEGKTETRLVLESAAPGQMDMLVTGKPVETFYELVPARFLPVGGQTFDGRVAETVTNGIPAILWSSTIRMLPDSVYEQYRKKAEQRRLDAAVRPPPIDLAEKAAMKLERQKFAAAANELEVQSRRNRPVILETGPLGAAIKTFDQCGEDSLKAWGIDPALEEKIVRPVWALNPGGWLFAKDYPSNMLFLGKESEVSVRLLIDATGKVTKCTSLSHFADKEFNRITCDLIVERARFAPAELADGTKVPSYVTRRVRFQIGR